MKQKGLSLVGLTGVTAGVLALVTWLCWTQLAAGDNADSRPQEPEPFIPSETISPHQAVAFPTNI